MTDRLLVRVTAEPLEPAEAVAFVTDSGAGGICVFLGTVRDHSEAGDVTGLEYEAWAEMAERSLAEAGEEMLLRWPVRRAALLHRTGRLEIQEVSVVVACSAPHRAEAFEACRHGIERVKSEAPIWKKESLVGGEAHWVKGS